MTLLPRLTDEIKRGFALLAIGGDNDVAMIFVQHIDVARTNPRFDDHRFELQRIAGLGLNVKELLFAAPAYLLWRFGLRRYKSTGS